MGMLSYIKEEIKVIRERDPATNQIWKYCCIPVLRRFSVTG